MRYSVKRKEATVAIVLLASVLTCAQFVGNALALECNVMVEAPTEVFPSTTFNVSIIAENIPDQEGGVYGWEIVLRWTPGVLNCTGETLNYDFWPVNSGPLVAKPIDNDTGEYHQALSCRAPSTPVIGTYWLVNVTFLSGPYICNKTDLIVGPTEGLAYCLVDKTAGDIVHGYVQAYNLHVVPEFLETALFPLLMILAVASLMLTTRMRKRW